MHPHSVGTNHCISRYRSLVVSYRPGPVGLRYSPREVCTSVARGMLTHIPSIHDHDISRHNNTPMIHASFLFPCIHFLMFHICMSFPSSPRLTWLADPALVTLVYPNRMQYTPCVLQEASLLDGVDASVRGNSRRFSKTSSYPPCRHYAFNPFYPYYSHNVIVPFVLADSSLSHDPLHPRLTLQIFPTLFIAFVPLLFPSSCWIGKYFLTMAEQCN